MEPEEITFRRLFGINKSFKDHFVSRVFGKYKIDVVGLDDYMHTHFDYSEEKDGSLRDFILKKFGTEACEFVTNHL